jgi:hypothetical protein
MSLPRRPPLLPLLVALFAAAAALAWGLELHLSDPLHRGAAKPPPEVDPAGRRLFVLIIDSLAPDDLDGLPAVAGLGGFSARVEPCADNYTYPCIHEALTGRPTFSLFSFLDNMGVLERDLGDNLIADLRAAGKRVAVISRGDLHHWGAQADTVVDIPHKQKGDELPAAIAAMQDHDVILHHWVWHDIVSHHSPRGTAAYARSLAETQVFAAGVVGALPPDMDLLVMGDHGHLDDGRHLQGLDTPTEVRVKSPRLRPVRPEGRVPITAIRTLAAAVTGVGSAAVRVEPAWRGWMAPGVADSVRLAGEDPIDPGADIGLPWLALGAGLALGLLAGAGAGWGAGLGAAAFGFGLGLAYPALHALNLDDRGPREVFWLIDWLPPAVGLISLARGRDPDRAWRALATCSAAIWLGVLPVLGPEGVLRNLEAILIPPVLGAALLQALSLRRGAPWRAGLPPLLLLVGAATAMGWSLSMLSNDVQILKMSFTDWPLKQPGKGAAAAAALGAALSALALRPAGAARWTGALALGAAAPLLPAALPEPLKAVAFGAAAVVALLPRAPAALRLGLLLLATGICLDRYRQVGALFAILPLAAFAAAAPAVARGRPGPTAEGALKLALAVALGTGTYLSMAWTIELKIAGLDWGFTLPWLPGELHERLWFVITAAMVLKTFLPLLLLVEVGRAHSPLAGPLRLGARLAGARFAASALFCTGWVAAQGADAATRRLLRVLQDGFGWLLIAAALGAMGWVAARAAQRSPPAAAAQRW